MRLRDGTEVADPRLGRLVQFDPLSRGYPVRALLRTDQQIPRTRLWYLPSTAEVLDQGATSACVGNGVTNELRYTPIPVKGLDEPFALDLYRRAQAIDPWADQPHEGTSVLAGIKAAQDLGYYTAYHWAFGEPDLALAVGHIGPSVIGVPWLEGMMQVDGRGYIHATGEALGGHCVLVVGISLTRDDYTIANSWGDGWAPLHRGRALISRADMARLLSESGEAVVITGRARPRVAR